MSTAEQHDREHVEGSSPTLLPSKRTRCGVPLEMKRTEPIELLDRRDKDREYDQELFYLAKLEMPSNFSVQPNESATIECSQVSPEDALLDGRNYENRTANSERNGLTSHSSHSPVRRGSLVARKKNSGVKGPLLYVEDQDPTVLLSPEEEQRRLLCLKPNGITSSSGSPCQQSLGDQSSCNQSSLSMSNFLKKMRTKNASAAIEFLTSDSEQEQREQLDSFRRRVKRRIRVEKEPPSDHTTGKDGGDASGEEGTRNVDR